MERLNYHTVYLSGAIDSISREKALSWREEITPFLKDLGMLVLDPMLKIVKGYEEDEEFFKRKRQLKKSGKFQELHNLGKPIRAYDLNCVDISTCVLVCFDPDIKICGTLNEVFTQDAQRGVVLFVCEKGLDKVPDWLYFTFPSEFFFSNWDDLKIYLSDIHTGKKTDFSKRWWILDYSRILPEQLKPAQPKPQSNPRPKSTPPPIEVHKLQ